jgi:hypothetical protein
MPQKAVSPSDITVFRERILIVRFNDNGLWISYNLAMGKRGGSEACSYTKESLKALAIIRDQKKKEENN